MLVADDLVVKHSRTWLAAFGLCTASGVVLAAGCRIVNGSRRCTSASSAEPTLPPVVCSITVHPPLHGRNLQENPPVIIADGLVRVYCQAQQQGAATAAPDNDR